MGASGKWVKTLIGFKKHAENDELIEKLGGENGNKKWKLWKNPSGDWKKGFKTRRHSESETTLSPPPNDAFNDAIATVIKCL